MSKQKRSAQQYYIIQYCIFGIEWCYVPCPSDAQQMLAANDKSTPIHFDWLNNYILYPHRAGCIRIYFFTSSFRFLLLQWKNPLHWITTDVHATNWCKLFITIIIACRKDKKLFASWMTATTNFSQMQQKFHYSHLMARTDHTHSSLLYGVWCSLPSTYIFFFFYIFNFEAIKSLSQSISLLSSIRKSFFMVLSFWAFISICTLIRLIFIFWIFEKMKCFCYGTNKRCRTFNLHFQHGADWLTQSHCLSFVFVFAYSVCWNVKCS